MNPLLLPYIFNIVVLVPLGLMTLLGGERGGRIAERELQAFLNDLQTTLDKFRVPAAERQELFAIVESTKADIVPA